MINLTHDEDLFQKIINDPSLRLKLCQSSHLWFFNIYFSSYIKYELAHFHRNFFALTENQDLKFAVISAFRGSGKSTILTTSHAIWAIFGFMQKKNILLISQTQPQARTHLKSIKDVLGNNHLIKHDFGPLEETQEEWNASSVTLKKYNAKITCASLEQSIRGIRHHEHRPDLIICDDIEDENSVRNKESRDKTFDLLTGEIIPTGDLDTSIWIIGNLLHEDSVISRLEENMLGKPGFYTMRIPIIDENSNPTWPGKFPTKESVEKFKDSMPNQAMWFREYLLKIVKSDEKVIDKEWIKYYDTRPSRDHPDYRYTIISVDPAISEKETADYTAIITADIFGYGNEIKIYVLPIIFNKRFTANELIQKIKDIYKIYGQAEQTTVLIENVGFQSLLINMFENEFNDYVDVTGVTTKGKDKRSRCILASGSMENGEVLFPRRNSKELIRQLLDFPMVKHDDLVDSLSMLINYVNEDRGTQGGCNGGLITTKGLVIGKCR